MKLRWYGQARIHIETGGGESIRIVCDPYDSSLGYKVPSEKAEIVTVSHGHFDHSAVDTVKGSPEIIDSAGEYEIPPVRIKGIKSWHDNSGGKERGSNVIFRFEMENIIFVHMGDIGHVPSSGQLEKIKPCDILAVPVGGVYTIDSKSAYETVNLINPRVVIPMHYDTPSNKIGLQPLGYFSDRFLDVQRLREFAGGRDILPKNLTVWELMAHGER